MIGARSQASREMPVCSSVFISRNISSSSSPIWMKSASSPPAQSAHSSVPVNTTARIDVSRLQQFELHELVGHARNAPGGCCALSIKAEKPSRHREHRHQQYAEYVEWRHLRGLASPHLMTDFSSNHFQKARASPTFLQDNRWNVGATQETVAILCCVAYTIDIEGGATKDL